MKKNMPWVLLGVTTTLLLISGLIRRETALIRNNVDARNQQHPESAQIDSHSPYDKKELQNWIHKLSSKDAAERKTAESELAKAGVFADSALNAAEANATGTAKEAIQHLKNRRRFAGLSNLDYGSALPANSLLYLHVPDIQQALDKSKLTSFGKLMMRPACDALRKKMWSDLQHDETGALRQPPLDYVKGQFAVSVFHLGDNEQAKKLGVLLEMKGDDIQGEYHDWSSNLLSSGGSIREYKNIENIDAGSQRGAHARTGNSILFGSDGDALHALIDTVLSGKGVGDSSNVKSIYKSLGPFPDGVLFADIPTLARQTLLSKENEPLKPNEDIVELLLENFGYAGASTTSTRDGFEDRIVCLLPEGPGGLLAAFTKPKGTPPPIESFSLIPSDAVAAVVGYVDGATIEKTIADFYKDVKTLRHGKKLPAENDAPLISFIRGIEKVLNLPPGHLFSLVKGEVGVWLELKGTDDISNGELSGLITAVDEKSANELAGILDSLNSLHLPGIFTKIPYHQHTIHSVNTERNGDAGRGLTWMVDSNRVYLASSVLSIKRQVDNVERHMPGLLKREPLQKALASFKPDEQTGTVLFIDAKRVATRFAETSVPQILADKSSAPEFKEALKQLPPPVDLFTDFPPLIAFTVTRADRAEIVVHSPLPLIPLALFGTLNQIEKQNQAAVKKQ